MQEVNRMVPAEIGDEVAQLRVYVNGERPDHVVLLAAGHVGLELHVSDVPALISELHRAELQALAGQRVAA